MVVLMGPPPVITNMGPKACSARVEIDDGDERQRSADVGQVDGKDAAQPRAAIDQRRIIDLGGQVAQSGQQHQEADAGDQAGSRPQPEPTRLCLISLRFGITGKDGILPWDSSARSNMNALPIRQNHCPPKRGNFKHICLPCCQQCEILNNLCAAGGAPLSPF